MLEWFGKFSIIMANIWMLKSLITFQTYANHNFLWRTQLLKRYFISTDRKFKYVWSIFNNGFCCKFISACQSQRVLSVLGEEASFWPTSPPQHAIRGYFEGIKSVVTTLSKSVAQRTCVSNLADPWTADLFLSIVKGLFRVLDQESRILKCAFYQKRSKTIAPCVCV